MIVLQCIWKGVTVFCYLLYSYLLSGNKMCYSGTRLKYLKLFALLCRECMSNAKDTAFNAEHCYRLSSRFVYCVSCL